MSEREPLRPSSDSQRMALDEAVSRYQAALTPDVEQYLYARGLNPETVDIARLGVVSDPEPGHGAYVGWLAIPYLRHDGQAVSIRFRCLKDHEHKPYHGKYMSLEGEPARVYYIPAIHAAEDTIHVCEGELDALILNQVRLPAVAIPGSTGWTSVHRRMLAGFNTIWVWGDPDDAGAKFTATVMRSMRQARGVRLTVGDVSETYQSGGPQAIYSLLQED